ncbi:MAG: nucleotide exchange factor GrpE [Bacteroidota bacterium]
MSKKPNPDQQENATPQDEAVALDNEQQENADSGKKKASSRGKKQSKTDKLQAEVEELNIQLAEQKDKFLRLFAEFDNFKKRTVKEKIEFMNTAAQDTLAALLPILDDFDRAKKNAEDENSAEPFSEGVMLVYNKLYNTLQQRGLKPMETNGEAFDPEFHEAITEIPAPTEDMKGKIIDTIEKGYVLKEKIIRHAKVVVGK